MSQKEKARPTRPESESRDGEDDVAREQRDPESPGATIDCPTPAEPNEPG